MSLQDSEQSIKHDIISVCCAGSDHVHCHRFTEQDVKSSIRSLNAGKTDDIDGLMSDYFKHSTGLMIEIITCILKSKAFDRLHHEALFQILKQKGICPLISRIIFNMYTHSTMKVR